MHDAMVGQERRIVNGERPALIPEALRRELDVPADARSVLQRRRDRERGAAGAVDR